MTDIQTDRDRQNVDSVACLVGREQALPDLSSNKCTAVG